MAETETENLSLARDRGKSDGFLPDPPAGGGDSRLPTGAHHHDRRGALHHDHLHHGDGRHHEGGLLLVGLLLRHDWPQLLHPPSRGHFIRQESVLRVPSLPP